MTNTFHYEVTHIEGAQVYLVGSVNDRPTSHAGRWLDSGDAVMRPYPVWVLTGSPKVAWWAKPIVWLIDGLWWIFTGRSMKRNVVGFKIYDEWEPVEVGQTISITVDSETRFIRDWRVSGTPIRDNQFI